MNTRLSSSDKAWLLNDSEAKVFFVGEEYLDEVASIRGELETVKHIISISGSSPGMIDYEELIADSSPEAPEIRLDDDEIGSLWYTAGPRQVRGKSKDGPKVALVQNSGGRAPSGTVAMTVTILKRT